MTKAKAKWYWLYTQPHGAGCWIHNGPCRFVAVVEQWEMHPCGLGLFVEPSNDGRTVCYACKRWEPPDADEG